MRKLSKDEFIFKSNEVHANKYEYSLVEYKNNSTKVDIICREHGIFRQVPGAHMQGQGCPLCGGGIKYDKNLFISKSNKVHNNRYDYSLVDYIDSYTKVNILCKEHGIFDQSPANHISGQGCSVCAKVKKYTTVEFVELSKCAHNNKYDYSLVDFKSMSHRVKIICPEHGIFEQKANNHLNLKQGCINCTHSRKHTTESFINKCKEIHNDFYLYDKVEYKSANIPVEIICKKHGSFYQRPTKHLSMNGCPVCKMSNGELKIISILNRYKIDYKYQHKFDNFNLVFDFYIPNENTCIEFDGIQHYKPVTIFGGIDSFHKQVQRDLSKNIYCETNGVKLIRIPYYDIKNITKYLPFLL